MTTPATVDSSRSGMEGARFHGVSFDTADQSTRLFGPDDLRGELSDPGVFSWVDIEGPDIEALNEVLRCIDVDLVLVGHFGRPEILPRIVERPDCLAFYLYEVADPERHLDTSRGLAEIEVERMILVLGADYVLTYHQRPLEAVAYVKESCAESFRLAGQTPGFVVFLFLHRCLYDYAHLNLANDNYLDMLEASLLADDRSAWEGMISTASGNILALKRLAASLHIVLMLIATKRNPFVSEAARASFGEMLENAIAVRASIDSSRDMLDGIISSLQTAAANRTNDIARVLTVVSAIILPLTLISGVYGMNFEYMPELKSPYGYFVVLGVMAAIAAALLVIFRRLGWFGKG